MSFVKDVVNIYKTASAVLISAAKTAARAIADAQKGSSSFIAVGNAMSCVAKCGNTANVHIPSIAGMKAKANYITALYIVPFFIVLVSLAPKTIPTKPGDMKNDGVSMKKYPIIIVAPKPKKLK